MENSHVTYSQEMHWRMAAKWNGMSWDEFIEHEGDEQSRLVAAYETSMQMEVVMAMDANRIANRRQKRGHSGS